MDTEPKNEEDIFNAALDIASPDGRYIGVQFHPELSNPKVKRSIFRWFLTGACYNKKNKLRN